MASAHDAVQHMGGVTSARGGSILADLRNNLARHRSTPAVRDFIELTAS